MTGPTITGNLLQVIGVGGAYATVAVKAHTTTDAARYGADARIGTRVYPVPTDGALTVELPAPGWWDLRIDPVRKGNVSFQRITIVAEITVDTTWGELVEIVTDPLPANLTGRSLDDRFSELLADSDSDAYAAFLAAAQAAVSDAGGMPIDIVDHNDGTATVTATNSQLTDNNDGTATFAA